MISRTYRTEPSKENPHKVDVKQLYDKASAQVMHITLQAGEALKPQKRRWMCFSMYWRGHPLCTSVVNRWFMKGIP